MSDFLSLLSPSNHVVDAHARLLNALPARTHHLPDAHPVKRFEHYSRKPARGLPAVPPGPRECSSCLDVKDADGFPKGRWKCKTCTNAALMQWKRQQIEVQA